MWAGGDVYFEQIKKCYKQREHWFTVADPHIFRGGGGGGGGGAGGGGRYMSATGWSVKNILGFRWSKKTEKMLETISFWQNIFISFFKFSPFLSITSYQFFKIY